MGNQENPQGIKNLGGDRQPQKSNGVLKLLKPSTDQKKQVQKSRHWKKQARSPCLK